ncbi:MAG: hypothetical protein QOK35_1867 [Pseudonocardiales bacterium]|nr:hypothetical protein [Pseudonocardiales bacterium]
MTGPPVTGPPVVGPPAPRPPVPRLPVRSPGLFGLLVLDGLLLGAIGLVLTPMYVGSVPAPVGAVLSILVLPWLVLRAGEIDPRPGVAGAPLLTWLLAVGGLGIGGPGGDVILPATWQSALLAFGGLFAGLLALRRVLIGGTAWADERGRADVRGDE